MSVYYQDEHVTIHHGDCRDIAPSIGADVVVTDPPYGDTSLVWDQWPVGWVKAVAHIPVLWSFGSMRMFLDNHTDFKDAGYKYAQEIIWEKHNGSGFLNDRFKRVHEIAMQWYQGAWGDLHKDTPRVPAEAKRGGARSSGHNSMAHFGTSDKGNTYMDDGMRLMKSVVRVNSMNGKALHPTEKPGGILAPLIQYSAAPEHVVLDPFAGSGSTLFAARQAGRKSIGIEASEEYCETAARRFDQQTIDFGLT